MLTIQQMIDEAMDEGASVQQLVGNFYLKFTDTGSWYFVDTADRPIDETDAQRLLDCFTIGYVD